MLEPLFHSNFGAWNLELGFAVYKPSRLGSSRTFSSGSARLDPTQAPSPTCHSVSVLTVPEKKELDPERACSPKKHGSENRLRG